MYITIMVRISGVIAIFTESVKVLNIFSPQLCQSIQEQSFKATKSSFRTCIDPSFSYFFYPYLTTVGVRNLGHQHHCV